MNCTVTAVQYSTVQYRSAGRESAQCTVATLHREQAAQQQTRRNNLTQRHTQGDRHRRTQVNCRTD